MSPSDSHGVSVKMTAIEPLGALGDDVFDEDPLARISAASGEAPTSSEMER